jgi:hypothetical protein
LSIEVGSCWVACLGRDWGWDHLSFVPGVPVLCSKVEWLWKDYNHDLALRKDGFFAKCASFLLVYVINLVIVHIQNG